MTPSHSSRRTQRTLAVVVSLLFLFFAQAGAASRSPLPVLDGVGGDFSAASTLDRVVDLAEFRGKVVLMFFGYTTCQDICPATLSHLKVLVDRLGPDAERVQVMLITVDPKTDTVEHLKQYLARFDSSFIGMTGDAERLAHIAHLFGVKHAQEHGMEVSTQYNRSKTFTDHSYLYSHSQQIYLLDKQGRTRALYFVGSPVDEMKADILGLLRETESANAGEASATHRDH